VKFVSKKKKTIYFHKIPAGVYIERSRNAGIERPFNTEGMYRGVKTSEGEDLVSIYG